MKTVYLESGVVLGFGGTNARRGVAKDGDIQEFKSVPTPKRPKQFFTWMARQVLATADQGHGWLVAGFPGPVSKDGKLVGPMVNVQGMSKRQFNLRDRLTDADPAVGRLVRDEGFDLLSVNDGDLAAHAVAKKIGEGRYSKVAALIIGTGVGAGVVERDATHSNVYHSDRSLPTEIGHIMESAYPLDTPENAISGPALAMNNNVADARDLDPSHSAWKTVGETAGRYAMLLGLMYGANLVVPTGGVGAGASERYKPYLEAMMDGVQEHGNATQKQLRPEIMLVPEADAQIIELFGGAGAMLDYRSSQEQALAA